MQPHKFPISKGVLYIAVTTIIFSTMEIALKMSAGQFAPIQIVMLRFFFGGLLLLPVVLVSLKRRQVRLRVKDLVPFLWLGFLCIVVSMTFYQLAVERTPASVVAVLFSGNPVVISMLAFFVLRERITKYNIIALALDIIGILIIVNPFHTTLDLAGVLFTLLTIVTFSLYSVLGKKYSQAVGSLTVSGLSILVGALELLVILALGHLAPVAQLFRGVGLSLFAETPLFSGIADCNLPVFLWLCVANSAGGYYFYMKAMEATSTHEAALTFFFKPVLASLLAMWLLQETITPNMVVAIFFFLTGALFDIIPGLRRHRWERSSAVLK